MEVTLRDPTTKNPYRIGGGKFVDVTLVADTSILADGDVATDTAAISNAVYSAGGAAILETIILLDEDDQKIAADLVFLESSVSLGTKNAAPNISDANSRKILGVVNVATGDYADLGGASVATKRDVGLFMKAASGTKHLYVSVVTRGGTPTYTASGLKLRLGFRYVW